MANYIIQNEKKPHKNLIMPLLMYWLFFIIWQNIGNYNPDLAFSNLIKFFMIGILAYYYIKGTVNFSIIRLVVWIFFTGFMIVECTTFEPEFTGQVAIHYYFPIVFSFMTLVCRFDAEIKEEEFVQFLKLLIITVFVAVIYSILFQSQEYLSFIKVTKAYGSELSSFFVSNHEYGMYLVFGIISIFMYYKYIEIKAKKRLYIGICICFVISLIATLSRTSCIAFVGYLIVHFLFSENKKLRRSVGVCLIVCGMLLLIPEVFDFAKNILWKEGNDAGRIEMWNQAVNDFKNSDLLTQFFGRGFIKTNEYAIINFRHASLHNMFLQILFESGMVGLCFIIGIIISGFVSALKIFKTNREMSVHFIALFVSVMFFTLTNTAELMRGSIDSYMLTIFTFIIPKYISNAVYNNNYYKIAEEQES